MYPKYLLSLALGASVAFSAPTGNALWEPAQVYSLRIKADSKELNGKYLSAKNSSIGIFGSEDAYEFYTMPGDTKRSYELHEYPIGIISHQVALVGHNGRLKLTDAADPANTTWPDGVKAQWNSWVILDDSGNSRLQYKDGSESRWLAFPGGSQGGWTIDWFSGGATTDNYVQVEIEVVQLKSG